MSLLKKISVFIFVLVLVLLTGCGKANPNSQYVSNSSAESIGRNSDNDTVDLTAFSSTMVYSEVFNMLNSPEKYFGKTVRISGKFTYMKDDKTGNEYFAVIIADATACCQQGLEFVLKGEHKYPDDYPAEGAEVEVTGVFESYKEGNDTFYHLIDAELKNAG